MRSSWARPSPTTSATRTPHLLWKHFDIFTGTQETRPGRELVVRYATIVGNYDYFLEWVFSQNGAIRLNTGAGGIMEMKAVRSTHRSDPTAAQDTLYGTLVDENLGLRAAHAQLHARPARVRAAQRLHGRPGDEPLLPLDRGACEPRRGDGVRAGFYCPTAPVSREQMGVFVSLTFGLTLYGP